MLRLLGFIALIYLIYRWIVRPMLILPDDEERRRRSEQARAMDWLQEQMRRQREQMHRQERQPRREGRSRRDEEYTDYEEVD